MADLSVLAGLAADAERGGARRRKKKKKTPTVKQWSKLGLKRDELAQLLSKEIEGNQSEENRFKRNVQALLEANKTYRESEEVRRRVRSTCKKGI